MRENGTEPATIVPRLDQESARAHAAKIAYVTMGPDRSLEKTRQRLGKDSAGYTRTLEEWSTKFDWPATARAWDDQQAAAVIAAAAEVYRKELEDHRRRYGDAGKALYQVAAQVLKQLSQIAGQQPMVIEGKDGKFYKVSGLELTPATLTTAARAMTIAADLEAHALRLGDILPKLDHDILDHE